MISTEHNRTHVCASKMSNEILIRFVFCHRRLFSNFQLSIIGSCVCWWCEKWKCATSVTHKGMRTNPQRMVSTPYGMLKCIAIEEVGLKRQYQMLFGTELIFKHTKPSCITMLGCVACIFCCSTTCKAFWCITDFCIVQTPVDGYMFGTADNRIDVTLAMAILVSSWLRRIRGFRTNDCYSNISRRISKLTYSHDHSTFHEKNRPESWEVCTEHIKMVEEIFDSQKQFQSFSRDVLISSEIEWESVR